VKKAKTSYLQEVAKGAKRKASNIVVEESLCRCPDLWWLVSVMD